MFPFFNWKIQNTPSNVFNETPALLLNAIRRSISDSSRRSIPIIDTNTAEDQYNI